jgi:hypothetical protein
VLHGRHRAKSVKTLLQSAKKRIARGDNPDNIVKGGQSGFGGHFRAVQGFRYYGEAAKRAAGERRGAC